MLGFGGNRKTGRSGRTLARGIMLLLGLLLAQVALASEALATNLVVNIVDNEDPIPLGGTITYTITIENEDLPTNSSPQTTLSLTIPNSFTFTGTEAGSPITGCTPQPGTGPVTVICTVPPIAGGPSSKISLEALVKTSEQGVFSVSASVPAGLSANPSASQPTTVTDGTDLTLDVTGPATSASGSQVAYDFTVNNLGPLSATNVVVSIPIPAGLENLVWPAGCVLSAGNYLCTVAGPIAVGATTSLQLKGQIAVASTSDITVTGEITSSNPPDRITSNNRRQDRQEPLTGHGHAAGRQRSHLHADAEFFRRNPARPHDHGYPSRRLPDRLRHACGGQRLDLRGGGSDRDLHAALWWCSRPQRTARPHHHRDHGGGLRQCH